MANDSFSGGIINQLFSGLVQGRLAMEALPDIAASWELSANGCRYVFHLRNDVQWSDGTLVTAWDFVYTWQRVLNPVTQSPNASLLYDIKGAKEFNQGKTLNPDSVAAKAMDDFTLVVELDGPSGYFLSLMAHYATYPVPMHVVQVYNEAWTDFEHIITNGAFKIESWDRGRNMTLQRNPNYRGQFEGNLQRVEISFDIDWSDQLKMYEDEELDFLSFGGTPAQRDRARRRHAGEYASTPMLGTTYVGFDVSRAPFSDSRVRRAFAMAIDKVVLADELLRGYEYPALGGFVPPGMPGHSKSMGPPYDPAHAQLLLEEAGYPEGRDFPAVEAWTWQAIKPRAEFLQAQWRENLKVDIAWHVMDFPQFIKSVDNGSMHILQTVWIPDYPDPDSVLRASPVRRRACWQNPAYEKLVENARRVLDQEKRMDLYAQADRLLVENQAIVIPLTYMSSHMLVKPWVRKFPRSAINEWLWKDFIIEEH
jgi:ABC-type oligopeptide transport system substrate-binding subunit